jgi:hypothetical protein
LGLAVTADRTSFSNEGEGGTDEGEGGTLNEELSPDFLRNLDLVEGIYGQKLKKCTFKNIFSENFVLGEGLQKEHPALHKKKPLFFFGSHFGYF